MQQEAPPSYAIGQARWPEVRISPERFEAMRMQELDGGRREDWVKFWGLWNADGPGCHYALVQYSGAGSEIAPIHARPGDFMNINWKSGLGHSVVFLGWHKDSEGKKHVLFWSSQMGTNGLGDQDRRRFPNIPDAPSSSASCGWSQRVSLCHCCGNGVASARPQAVSTCSSRTTTTQN